MKNVIQKPKGAKEKFGLNVKTDKKLDVISGTSLFPGKLGKANAIVSKLNLK